MRKTTCASLLVVLNIVASLALEAAVADKKTTTEARTSSSALSDGNPSEKFDIMRRDERSGTDALAIPLDESEVEDEEDINAYEKNNTFNLPTKK